MTRLYFDMEQVAGLARHSREAPRRRMTIAQRAEIYGEERCADRQPGEERLAPPCLWLVKDEGIYLMSPGIHPGPESGDRPARAPVALRQRLRPDPRRPHGGLGPRPRRRRRRRLRRGRAARVGRCGAGGACARVRAGVRHRRDRAAAPGRITRPCALSSHSMTPGIRPPARRSVLTRPAPSATLRRRPRRRARRP